MARLPKKSWLFQLPNSFCICCLMFQPNCANMNDCVLINPFASTVSMRNLITALFSSFVQLQKQGLCLMFQPHFCFAQKQMNKTWTETHRTEPDSVFKEYNVFKVQPDAFFLFKLSLILARICDAILLPLLVCSYSPSGNKMPYLTECPPLCYHIMVRS